MTKLLMEKDDKDLELNFGPDFELEVDGFDEESEDQDWYYENLLDYVREETDDNEGINELLDQDILYLYELWDEYVQDIDGDEEEVQIDVDDLYQFVQKTAEEDEQDLSISQDNMVLLYQLQQEFDESLDDEDEDEEEDEED